MTHRQLKIGYFTLAGLNTLATSYYFNYLFFFLRDRFGFRHCTGSFTSSRLCNVEDLPNAVAIC